MQIFVSSATTTTYTTLAFAFIYASTIMLLIVAVAFFTVLERKVLAAIQRRRGPNLVGFWGLFQALADGLKLLMKEPLFVSGANYYIFLSAPIFLLTTSLAMWFFIPLPGYAFGGNTNYSFIVIFLFSSLNSYAVILAGLASNSRYSLIGGVRAIAQLISYEVPLAVSILILFTIQNSYSLYTFAFSKILFVLMVLPTLAVFFIALLAETNRTPFDLPEAEAELVAGYNLEYSSILFSLFFLAEYSNILVASSLLSLLFFGRTHFYAAVVLFCVVIILVRAILPRYTFAQLINLCWCVLLPAALFMLALVSVAVFLLRASMSDLIRPDFAQFVGESVAADGARAAEHVKLGAVCGVFARLAGGPLFLSADLNFVDGGVPRQNVVVFFLAALSIVCLLVGINWVIVNFRSNNRKNSPYECGFEPVGSPVSNFTPNFLSVGLIFLIYDVEVMLTFPWAYSSGGHSAAALLAFLSFILFMLLGLAYEIIDDAFTVVESELISSISINGVNQKS